MHTEYGAKCHVAMRCTMEYSCEPIVVCSTYRCVVEYIGKVVSVSRTCSFVSESSVAVESNFASCVGCGRVYAFVRP